MVVERMKAVQWKRKVFFSSSSLILPPEIRRTRFLRPCKHPGICSTLLEAGIKSRLKAFGPPACVSVIDKELQFLQAKTCVI